MQLTPFEIACGWVFDVDSELTPFAETTRDPFHALERAVLPALTRSPCVVSFSGGIDSSLVLAAATSAARSEGLPLPVPVTLRFPAAAETSEDEWQEAVIRHLGLADWVKLTLTDELDLVGRVAARGLLRHGLVWPANGHFHVPVFEQAPGGAALTGYGGDHVLSGWRWRRQADVLSGRARPTPRDALRVAFAAAPALLRRQLERRRTSSQPWLTARASDELRDLDAWVAASQPRSWDRWLGWQIGTRRVRLAQAGLALLAADHRVLVQHPLLDPIFVASLAQAGRRLGLGDRNAIVGRIAGGRLPEGLLARRNKARFGEAFWGPDSRAFVRQWDGSSADTSLVEVELLRREWSQPQPSFLTALLVQQAWLAGRSQDVGDAVEDVRHERPVPRAPELEGRQGGQFE